MDFNQLLDYAAEQLPYGWTINIGVERGAGWVHMTRPDGVELEELSHEGNMEEQVLAAIRFAQLAEYPIQQ